MSDQQEGRQGTRTPIERLASLRSLDPVALKWRSLIERRRAHLVDLYLSGRWKRYYSEEQFRACFRETMTIADRWTEIAPKPGDNAMVRTELTLEALSAKAEAETSQNQPL